jgi:hypothetical protein
MLQVDPTKRIRIDDLLRHRWLINNVYTEPVKWESIYQVESKRIVIDYFLFNMFDCSILEQIRCSLYT